MSTSDNKASSPVSTSTTPSPSDTTSSSSSSTSRNMLNKLSLTGSSIYSGVKQNALFISLLVLLVLFVICTFIILFYKIPTSTSTNSNISAQTITKNIFIVLFVIILIAIIAIILLPSLSEFKHFLIQIQNVLYVVLFTIGLILFFGLTPNKFLNLYSAPITIISILLGVVMFYMSFKQNYVEKFNIVYERIKVIILFFCFITLCILYSTVNLGGYITKYFGYSMPIIISLGIFILLYLIVLLTFPVNTSSTSTSGSTIHNLLNSFSWFNVAGSISFIIFLVIVTVTIYKSGIIQLINEISPLDINTDINMANFFSDKVYAVAVLILVLLTSILWVLTFVIHNYPELFKSRPPGFSVIEKIDMYKRAILILFGLIISGLIIAWVSYTIQNISGKSGIVNVILSIFLIIVLLALVYKTVVVQLPVGNARKNAFVSFMINLIFTIPCWFIDIFDWSMKHFAGVQNTSTTTWLLLLLAIILNVAYLAAPVAYNAINLQGGQMLLSGPENLNTVQPLGTYQDLNNKFQYGSDEFDYQYAISFWFYLAAVPPNTNSTSVQYANILNFGNNPQVSYNTLTNTLIVTMQNMNIKNNKSSSTNNTATLTNTDENDNTILYKKENVLLQKWNNMIINYNGGVLDIFLNGELMKSIPSFVPYYTLNNLTVGEDGGINGGICSVVYFNKPLTTTNMHYLYNMVKDLSPPVMKDYYWWNRVKNDIQTPPSNASYSQVN